ncbi:MAG: bifunctional diguanylate cyclase/phosphodiesterase [Dactylosporangium sp.]|nr:bifunctional diguanylate cyclase/phosphodiesterase [Dactylosporangium sp.]
MLACVILLGLSAVPLSMNVRATQEAQDIRQALRDAALVGAARAMITQENLEFQRYQLEPTAESRSRFTLSAAAATSALRDAQSAAGEQASVEASRLANEQAEYLRQVDLVLRAQGSGGASVAQQTAAASAFQVLAQDADAVLLSSSNTAKDQAVALHNAQLSVLVATLVTLVIGVTVAALGGMAALTGPRGEPAPPVVAEPEPPPHTDPLTELPDETAFAEHLHAALAEAQQSGGRGVTVLSINLNGFDGITQIHGHDGCDQVMVAASRRLRRVIRDVDLASRSGESGFAVLLRDMTNRPDVQAVTGRIERVLCRDFRIQSGITAVTASIGIAIGPPDSDPDDVVRRAHAAMRRIRSADGGVAFFEQNDADTPQAAAGPGGGPAAAPAPVSDLTDDLRMLLHAGDPDGQLVVAYQPIARLVDGVTSSAEAIVEWRHPTHGRIGPAELTGVAERSNLTTPLTARILDTVAVQALTWQGSGSPLAVTVSVSPRCLADPLFAPEVHAAIERAKVAPELLGLGLAEADAMANPDLVATVFGSLRRSGMRLTIDGYGVMPNSLPRLQRLQFDEVKLDRSLTRHLSGSPAGQAVVLNTIELAHTIGFSVVADDVGEADTLGLLHQFGCDHAQGPVLGGSLPSEAVAAARDQIQHLILNAIGRADIGT